MPIICCCTGKPTLRPLPFFYSAFAMAMKDVLIFCATHFSIDWCDRVK